jgi:hypothetical protein
MQLLEGDYHIRTVRNCSGTGMIYIYVLNRGEKGVHSPAARLWEEGLRRTCLTLPPGQDGAKQMRVQYGDPLVCARYRYDERQKSETRQWN